MLIPKHIVLRTKSGALKSTTKNEDDPKNVVNPKNEDNSKNKTTPNISVYMNALLCDCCDKLYTRIRVNNTFEPL